MEAMPSPAQHQQAPKGRTQNQTHAHKAHVIQREKCTQKCENVHPKVHPPTCISSLTACSAAFMAADATVSALALAVSAATA
jgi:hypothetical protein